MWSPALRSRPITSRGYRTLSSRWICPAQCGEMTKGRLLILVTVLTVLAVAATSFFLGDAYAVGSLSVREVTPDQLAQAMKADEFYSDFREDTLLVRGQVASVYGNAGGVTLVFLTSGV